MLRKSWPCLILQSYLISLSDGGRQQFTVRLPGAALCGLERLYLLPTISKSSASGCAPQRQGSPTLPNPRDTTRSDDRKAYSPSSRQKRLFRMIGGPFGRRICPPCV